MKLGAHVSTAGGLHTAFKRAAALEAETIQVFASSPRAWKFRELKPDVVERFREGAESTGIGPVFIHGSYLVNIAGAPDLVEKSVACLVRNMEVAAEIGAAGVVFHSGSHKGKGFDAVIGSATDALKRVLDESPDGPLLLVENSASRKTHLGGAFSDIGEMVSRVDSERFQVCLDTEHSFAAGYDISDPAAIEAAISEFDAHIGLDKLAVVHANDAKVEMGSGVDRHENIGEGYIGVSGFEVIMAHPAFADVPFVLEVPGKDKKGPDKDNLDRLKEIRSRLCVPA